MRAGWVVVVTLLGGFLGGCAGCLRDTAYKCSSNDQCGAGGICEMSVGGYCSFADPDCGRRFGPQAGSYANQCVGGGSGSDGSGSGSDGSGSGSDGSGSGSDSTVDPCPSDFMVLSGAPQTRKYKLITTADNWVNQKMTCGNLAAGHTYLAYPGALAEFQAMDALAGGNNTYWIGVSDLATAGQWMTVNNTTQTYLPWENGTPGNNPNDQCVEALTQNTTINNDTCTKTFPAICACD